MLDLVPGRFRMKTKLMLVAPGWCEENDKFSERLDGTT